MQKSGHTLNHVYTTATPGTYGVKSNIHLDFHDLIWNLSIPHIYFYRSMMHQLGHIARMVMERPWCLGVMGFVLVFVPIIGMWAVHKYNWQHWAPFDSHGKHK
jgi:hypothetical protein